MKQHVVTKNNESDLQLQTYINGHDTLLKEKKLVVE